MNQSSNSPKKYVVNCRWFIRSTFRTGPDYMEVVDCIIIHDKRFYTYQRNEVFPALQGNTRNAIFGRELEIDDFHGVIIA